MEVENDKSVRLRRKAWLASSHAPSPPPPLAPVPPRCKVDDRILSPDPAAGCKVHLEFAADLVGLNGPRRGRFFSRMAAKSPRVHQEPPPGRLRTLSHIDIYVLALRRSSLLVLLDRSPPSLSQLSCTENLGDLTLRGEHRTLWDP